MKETKKFFNNNRLNKGYNRTLNFKQSDAYMIRKKYQHVLPPIDMIEQYEDLNPGTLEQLLYMAEKEQNHRHSMELLITEKYIRAMRIGRMSAFVFVIIISITTLMLALDNNINLAAIFAISAFACITISSFFFSKDNIRNISVHHRKYNNHNQSYRSSDKKNKYS